MRKPDCEKAIRHLVTKWAKETGALRDRETHPSFSDFRAWVKASGYGQYLEFRSVMGPYEDAERWFDQELSQTWRN